MIPTLARWVAGGAAAVVTTSGVDALWGQVPALITALTGLLLGAGGLAIQYRRTVGDVQRRWRTAEELVTLLVAEVHSLLRDRAKHDLPPHTTDPRIWELLGIGPST